MKMLSLFSGIGGIDLAAEWAGIETIAFCEIDPFCQKVLKKHWPDVPIFPDIKELRGEDIGTVDIVAGGFPCQPYSVAGKQGGKEDDRDLWPEMFRVIQETKPTWIVGENVAGFVNMELERTLLDLESEGYETQTLIIPACAVNAKHQRYRTFIVGYSCSGGLSRKPRGGQGRSLRTDIYNLKKGLWPTPLSRDYKGASGRSLKGEYMDLPMAVNGSLNPSWVEVLMGFPQGWTDIDGQHHQDLNMNGNHQE